MGKKNNAARRNAHLSKCKTQKTGSQITDDKVGSIHGDPADPADPPDARPDASPRRRDPESFPDKVYQLAAVIFQNNHLEKPASHRLVTYGKARGLPMPEVRDELHHPAYDLAFNTLKYQDLLEDVIIDSCLHSLPDDQMSLVAVMLYDFLDRKFLPWERGEEEEFIRDVRDVQNRLLRFKTKLEAALARCRIKRDLLTIECVLPESVKIKQERSSCLPLYAWVNSLRSSPDEIQRVLQSAGLSRVKSVVELQGKTYCQDAHCGDVLVFPAQLRAELISTRLLCDRKLIIQDKSCSLSSNVASALLPDGGDVLVVGCFSGLTVTHIASLIAEKNKADGSNGQSKVYVCVSGCTRAQREKMRRDVGRVDCKNVMLLPETFQSLDSDDKRLQKVRVILLIPKCSVSAISNAVEFILQENGDLDLLQDLSHGSIAQSKLEALISQQRRDIDHALKFTRASAVVYSTSSSYPEENEEVVSAALTRLDAETEEGGNFRPNPSAFSSFDQTEGRGDSCGSFFVLKPSGQNNGCFLAVLTRESDRELKGAGDASPTESHGNVVPGVVVSGRQKRKKGGHTKRPPKGTLARTRQRRVCVSVQCKNQEIQSGDRSASCRQELPKRGQTPQGKAKALHLQASTNVTCNSHSKRPENNISSSFKPEKALKHASAPLFAPPSSAARPTLPLAAVVVSPRKASRDVPKPAALALPSVRFPVVFPNQNGRAASGVRRRSPIRTVLLRPSVGASSRDSLLKYRPLVGPGKRDDFKPKGIPPIVPNAV